MRLHVEAERTASLQSCEVTDLMECAHEGSRISVAMPVFNGGDYFSLALQSVLSQTHANLEALVIDDGSTDATEVARAVARYGDSRVKLLRQDNAGVAAALNRALEVASGDFFAWLSHDDLFKPTKLARQVAFHARLGRQNAVLFSDFELIDERGSVISVARIDREPLLDSPRLSLFRGCINGCTVFAPMKAMAEYAPFRSRLRYTQDYDMWRRMQGKFDFFLQREVLVSYRQHAAQGTNHPAAALESEAFWADAITSVSPFDKVAISGSQARFHAGMAEFLDGLPFPQAARLARDLSESNGSGSPVTIVVAADGPGAAGAVLSALRQTHRALDVVAVVPTGGRRGDLTQLAAAGDRLRVVEAEGDFIEAINVAAWTASGDYVAFQSSEARSRPDRIERQLGAMQKAGALICSAAVAAAEHTSPMVESAPWTTLTFHRSVIAAGARTRTGRIGRNERSLAGFGRQFGTIKLDEPLCSARELCDERFLG